MSVEKVFLDNNRTTAILSDSVPLTRWSKVVIGDMEFTPIKISGFGDTITFEGNHPNILNMNVVFS